MRVALVLFLLTSIQTYACNWLFNKPKSEAQIKEFLSQETIDIIELSFKVSPIIQDKSIFKNLKDNEIPRYVYEEFIRTEVEKFPTELQDIIYKNLPTEDDFLFSSKRRFYRPENSRKQFHRQQRSYAKGQL